MRSIVLAIVLFIIMLIPGMSQSQTIGNIKDTPITAVSTDHLTTAQLNDLRCMAKNIYHEARGSTYQNQLAVALVVRNRQARSGLTSCQEIFLPGQFHWTVRRLPRPAEHDAWALAQRIAYMVLFSEEVEDITQGATHFHELKVKPAWGHRATSRQIIGAHVFMHVPRPEEIAHARD